MTRTVVVTRFGMENVLKCAFPCGCHFSPVESETYEISYTVTNPYDKIEKVHVMCSNCRQKISVNMADRWLTHYDMSKF